MDVEKLIELVKENPILYNYHHPTYKDTKERDRTWKELATSLNLGSELLKSKWKNLRDSYLKHLKSKNTPAGQAAGKYRCWQWAKQMEFMEPHLGFAQSIINQQTNSFEAHEDTPQLPLMESDEEVDLKQFQNDIVEEAPVIIECYSSSTPFVKSRKRKYIRLRKPKPASEPTSTSDKVPYIGNNNCNSLDAMEHILLGYAKTIKTFSPRRQVEVKMKFAKVMMEAELQQIEEMSAIVAEDPTSSDAIYGTCTESPRNMWQSDSLSQDSTGESSTGTEAAAAADSELLPLTV